ncbi:M91 family zinc metallopeptidase [Pseudomonas sp. NPDC089406]|uniref:M91 family zinc metallopeptidase n=1 Tax=Pseudomonas sp. NPDC089406 TaxID=3364463 RepID=UPI00384EB00F
MQLDRISISHNGLASHLDTLPYRDHLLSAAREDHCLRITALQQASDLSVQPCAAGVELRIGGICYEMALPAEHTLHIKTGSGNDQLMVQTWADCQLVLETGEGDDEIRLHRAPSAASGGSVVVDAGPGNDVVVADGQQDVEIDAGAGNDFISSNAAQALLYAGPGNDGLKVEDGRANLEALAGSNRIATGTLDARIYANRGAIGEIDGFDAPLLFEPAQPGLPPAYAQTFDIQGDRPYVEKVSRQLDMLRASPAASVLLAELVAMGVKVAITYTAVLDNAFAGYEPSEGDARVRNGQRGARIRNCKILYNPLAHRFGTPSLVMLYHELCHVWNYATGSVIGDAEQQTVGLATGVAPFDFDDDPNTPPIDTNPKPFNENALRYELGLPPRTRYR